MWDRYGFVYLQGLYRHPLCLSAITVFFGNIDRNDFGHYAAFTRETISVVCAFYIWVLRGTPILLQLYFFWIFTQGVAGENIGQFLYYHSAYYQCQLLCGRGNQSRIQAVDKGQTEAARSLGMTGDHTMTQIILPQAIKNILPALGNEFITMIKQASLASVFFINELTTSYKTISSATFRPVEALMIAGIIYLMVTTVLGKIMEYAEWRMNRNER